MKFADVFREPIYNLSNFLSISRVLMLPPFIWVSNQYVGSGDLTYLGWMIIITSLVFLTDFFDGYFARRLNQLTVLGRYLDPICDKIVAIGAMIILVNDYNFPLWALVFYIIRELGGIWLGSFLFFKRNILGAPNQWGKKGVVLLSFAIIWYIAVPWLKTVLPAGHYLLEPVVSLYLFVLVLVGGVVSYGLTYWRVILYNEPLPDKNKPVTAGDLKAERNEAHNTSAGKKSA